MHSFTFSFTTWVWQHLPKRVRKLGENSIIGRFIAVLCSPIKELFLPISAALFEAMYESSRTGVELQKTGILYKLEKIESESDADFLLRLQKKKIINRDGNTKKAIKGIIAMTLGVDAEIVEETSLPRFIIGNTPLGTATCAESSYYLFVFKIILPDLSSRNIIQGNIRKYIDEYSPNNEYRIFERRESGLYEW